MTIYVLRYASEGDTSYINEAFTSKVEAKKRFNELRREAAAYLKQMEEEYLEPLVEEFTAPFEHYVRKVVVRNLADLIKLVNNL